MADAVMQITITVDDTGEVIVGTDPEELAIQEIFFWIEAAKFGILDAMRGVANEDVQ